MFKSRLQKKSSCSDSEIPQAKGPRMMRLMIRWSWGLLMVIWLSRKVIDPNPDVLKTAFLHNSDCSHFLLKDLPFSSANRYSQSSPDQPPLYLLPKNPPHSSTRMLNISPPRLLYHPPISILFMLDLNFFFHVLRITFPKNVIILYIFFTWMQPSFPSTYTLYLLLFTCQN